MGKEFAGANYERRRSDLKRIVALRGYGIPAKLPKEKPWVWIPFSGEAEMISRKPWVPLRREPASKQITLHRSQSPDWEAREREEQSREMSGHARAAVSRAPSTPHLTIRLLDLAGETWAVH